MLKRSKSRGNQSSIGSNSTIDPLKNLDVSHIALGSLLGSINIYEFINSECTENELIDSPAKFLDHKTTIHTSQLLTTIGLSEEGHLSYCSSRNFRIVDIEKPRTLLHSVYSQYPIWTLKYIGPFQLAVGGSRGQIGFLDTRCYSRKFLPLNFRYGQYNSFCNVKDPILKSGIRTICLNDGSHDKFYYTTYRGGIYQFDMGSLRATPIRIEVDSPKISFAGRIGDNMLISDVKGNITNEHSLYGQVQKLSLDHPELHKNKASCMHHMKHQVRFTPAVPVAKNSHICLFSSMLHYNSLTTFYHVVKLEPSLQIDNKYRSFSNAKHSNAGIPFLKFLPMRQNIQFNCCRAAPFHTSPIGKSNLIVVGYVSADAIINYFDDVSLTVKPLKILPATQSVNCVDYV